MQIGFKLMAEVFTPQELVRQAVRAGAHRARHRRDVPRPFRYHPAVIAQAAATTALLSDGRFVLSRLGRSAQRASAAACPRSTSATRGCARRWTGYPSPSPSPYPYRAPRRRKLVQ